MCLTKCRKINPGIDCYKVVKKEGNRLFSLFEEYPYKIGETYSIQQSKHLIVQQNLRENNVIQYIASDAFHSFTSLEQCKKYIKLYTEYRIKWDIEPLYMTIIKCHIPSSSQYTFKGITSSSLGDYMDMSSYASQQITVLEEIPVNN